MSTLTNVGDVSWDLAPLPRRRHDCSPQSIGRVDGALIERCPCGGMSVDGSAWTRRNTRKAPRHGLLDALAGAAIGAVFLALVFGFLALLADAPVLVQQPVVEWTTVVD